MIIGVFGYRGLVGRILKKRIKKYIKNDKIKYIKLNHFLFKQNFDILISCKDSIFSRKLYKIIKKKKWKGYFIDASSEFRMKNNSIIVLDPLNKDKIKSKTDKGLKIFCGSNCTVSLTMISLLNFFKLNLISKIYCNTYQAISGAGYKETISLFNNCGKILRKKINFNTLEKKIFKYNKKNLSFSLTPWIGDNKYGTTDEELKGSNEINKILKSVKLKKIKVYSTCVRVNVLRCHSISLLLKLKKKTSKNKFIKILKNNFIKIIKNKKSDTVKMLNPVYVSGRSTIYVGRIRKISKKIFSIFIVGDQLIWGAVEPIIRTAKIILKKNK
ncbi:aspartate-semialdehyde dehydrogenase [Candidatus Vidania fulgoroideorum]